MKVAYLPIVFCLLLSIASSANGDFLVFHYAGESALDDGATVNGTFSFDLTVNDTADSGGLGLYSGAGSTIITVSGGAYDGQTFSYDDLLVTVRDGIVDYIWIMGGVFIQLQDPTSMAVTGDDFPTEIDLDAFSTARVLLEAGDFNLTSFEQVPEPIGFVLFAATCVFAASRRRKHLTH